jgi:hypothetical protein
VSAASRSPRVLRIAIILVLVFNLMALVVLIRENPIAFTLFMFVGQPLFALALVLLIGALLAELRSRQII